MEIKLAQPKTIIIQDEKSVNTDIFNIDHVVDYMDRVEVSISIDGISKNIVLWDGQEYINIGQWTDTDVLNRLNELL